MRDRHITEIHEAQPIPCPKCPKSFIRKDDLRDHLDFAHDTRAPNSYHSVECHHCKKKFTNEKKLVRHIREIHYEGQTFSCPICSKDFSRQENLKVHISDVHEEAKTFSCPKCSQLFSQTGKLNRHISDVHKEEKNWECDQCTENYSRWENLQRHLDRGSHSFSIEGGCPHCKEDPSFKSETAMNAHFIKYKGMPETCVTMRMRSRQENKRKVEELKRLENEVHYCPVCKKHYKGVTKPEDHIWDTSKIPSLRGQEMCFTLFYKKNKEFGLKRTGVLEFKLNTLVCGCGCKRTCHEPGFHY